MRLIELIAFIALVVGFAIQYDKAAQYKNRCKRLEALLREKEAYIKLNTESVKPPKPIEKQSQNQTAHETAASETVLTESPNTASIPEPKPVFGSELKAAPTSKAVKKQGRVSSINIMLILGALLIIISGLIFATGTWKFLSGGLKTTIILSLSGIFFAASFFSERRLNLEKTGLLFYTLGSVFLPITIIAIGFFKIFGEWFSLYGGGCPLLMAAAFAALFSVCIIGSFRYACIAFSWMGLISFSALVCSLILQFTDAAAIFALAVSVYALAVIFAAEFLSRLHLKGFEPIRSQLNSFAVVNTVCLSIASLTASEIGGDGMLTLVSCVILASGYLKSCFTKNNGFGGAVPFALFITAGMFSVFSPSDFRETANTLAAASAVPSVLSLMNAVPSKLRSALKHVSGFFAAISLLICTAAAFITDPSWVSLAAYAVLAAEILALGLIYRSESGGRLMLRIFPIACIILATMLSRLIFTDDLFLRYLVCLGIATLMQSVFVLSGKSVLRTAASDVIFSVFGIIAEICVITNLPNYSGNISADILYLSAFIVSVSIIVLPAAKTKNTALKICLSAIAVFWASAGAYVLKTIIPHFGLGISPRLVSLISMTVISAALMTASLIAEPRNKNTAFDAALSVMVRVAAIIYAFIALIINIPAAPFFALAALFSLIRLAARKSGFETASALLLFFAAVGTGAEYFLSGVGYRESLLFVCGAAALSYLCVQLIGRNGSCSRTADAVSRYVLGILTCICMIYITHIRQTPLYIALTAFFMILTIAAFYKSGFTLFPALPLALLYPAAAGQIKEYMLSFIFYRSYTDMQIYISKTPFNIINITILTIIVLSVIMSFILHRNGLWEREGRRYRRIDCFALTRFIGVSVYLYESGSYKAAWLAIFAAALSLLSMGRRNQSAAVKAWIYTFCAAAPVIAWISQPFFELPQVFALELNILPVLIYCFALRFLWKSRPGVIDSITFAVCTVSYILLFFSGLKSGEIADGLIIVTSSFIMLIISFFVKRKKWFILSVAVLVISTLFMSGNFRLSVSWWVYLLTAGIILIAIGTINEMKKRAASGREQSELEKKVSRFMSEWTW